MDNPPKILRIYPYRTARIDGNLKYFTEDIMESLLTFLQKSDGRRFQNHTCYDLEDSRGNKFAMMFSDGDVVIGDRVVEKRW